jgi:integrase
MRLTKYRGKYAVYWRDEAGLPKRVSLGTDDPTLAQRRLQEFKDNLERQQNASGYTIGDLWERRKQSLTGRRMAVSMGFSGRSVLRFFGHHRPEAITEHECQDYIHGRRELGRKDGTILTELNHLRSTLTWAKKKKLINEAPDILRPPRPPPKLHYLTKPEMRRFLEACTAPHIYLFAILAVSTGARATALLELTWDRVNLDSRLIELRTEDMANRKGRATVPINDKALEALQEAKGRALTPYVIEWAGDRVRSVKKGIKSTANRAELTVVSPHVFRHSAAVWMAEARIPMEEIAQFLGHTNPEITRRVYARFSPDYLRNAARALEL